MNPRVQVGMAALAVAYNAKLAAPDTRGVDAMVQLAQQLLPAEDPLARACTHFATQFELHWRDPAQLIELGCNLQRDVELHSPALPPDHGRRDIHG